MFCQNGNNPPQAISEQQGLKLENQKLTIYDL